MKMAEESDYTHLPIEEKLQHNIWKVRLSGYQEAKKLFLSIDDTSPDFLKCAGLLKYCMTDVNVICHAKGLEAVSVFLSKADVNDKTACEVIKRVTSSCLGTMKNTVVELGKEILMLCIESGHQEIVVDYLVVGLQGKNVKAVIACIVCLKEAIRDFGNEVIKLTPISQCIPSLMKHTNADVREEAVQLILEMYRWTGPDAIQVMLENLSHIQKTRISETLGSVNREKVSPVRFLRSRHDYRTKRPKLDIWTFYHRNKHCLVVT